MKTILFKTLAVVSLLALYTSCSNRDAEKKIAALEARLAEIEGKGTSAAGTAITTASATPAEVKPEGPLPVMTFNELEWDFGTIQEGAVVEHTYEFVNNGEAPLIIQEAKPSCGCTVPDWSKEPIPVGGKGYIKASFDSNGKPNIQN